MHPDMGAFFLLAARHFVLVMSYDVVVNQRKEGTKYENDEIDTEHHLHDTICDYRSPVLCGRR